MTFRESLSERAEAAGISIPELAISHLEQYYDLLRRWNRTINLTGLPLEDFPAETVDRLLLEPLIATRLIDASIVSWVDMGSGGGSPAIPLKIACPSPQLTMVESKERKAAFLREAVRMLRLTGTSVVAERFESLSDKHNHSFDLLTVRAVRLDSGFGAIAKSLLKSHGKLFAFAKGHEPIDGFHFADSIPIGGDSRLSVYERLD